MRFTSKMIGRQATKSEKQIAVEERKAKEALSQNNMVKARIHAENAIRSKGESESYMMLQANLEAVAAKLQAHQFRMQVSESMAMVTSQLDQALGTMDVMQISYTMEKFIEQDENLTLGGKAMDGALREGTTSAVPQSDVNGLLMRIADEHQLDVGDRVMGHTAPVGRPVKVGEGVEDDLESRMQALQGDLRK